LNFSAKQKKLSISIVACYKQLGEIGKSGLCYVQTTASEIYFKHEDGVKRIIF